MAVVEACMFPHCSTQLCPLSNIWFDPLNLPAHSNGKKITQSEDDSAVKGDSLAIREPPFNYDTQEIIPRMGLVLIRGPGLLDDSSRNLRKLITKVEGRGAGDWASGNLIGLSSPSHN